MNLQALTAEEQRYLEGYAAALQDLQYELTGDNNCSKHYDPLTCEASVMHSYAFNMKDGGRHHPVCEYASLDEIKKTLLEEITQELRENTLPC